MTHEARIAVLIALSFPAVLFASGCGRGGGVAGSGGSFGSSGADGGASLGGESGTGGVGAGGAGGRGTGGSAVDAGGDAIGDGRRPMTGDRCWTREDCTSGGQVQLFCQGPGDPFGCGTCMQPGDSCASDDACRADGGANLICEFAPPERCFCTGGTKICLASCSTSGCREGQICDVDGRCKPKPCTSQDQSCSPDFSCDGTGHCSRKTCRTNADCPSDCVNGACRTGPGTCQFLPV